MMKRTVLITVSLLAWGYFVPNSAQCQIKGKELYDLMGERDLLKTRGITKVHWLPQGMGYVQCERDSATNSFIFIKINPISQTKTVLFSRDTANDIIAEYKKITGIERKGLPFPAFSYVLDGNAIRFRTNDGDFLFHLTQKKLRRLKLPYIQRQPGTENLMNDMEESQLWNGSPSPDFNHIAFVKEYDLYLFNTITGKEERLTFNGTKELMNGRPDWVYPEELAQRDAYWWSPDSKKIAFLQFDTHAESEYPLVDMLHPKAQITFQKYPKTGDLNPEVKLILVDIATKQLKEIKTNHPENCYLYKPAWTVTGKELFFLKLNRPQTRLELWMADSFSGDTTMILSEVDDTYINRYASYHLLDDGKHFIWSSERDGWMHLYLYDLQGNRVTRLTQGKWEVDKICKIDEENDWIYFTAFMNHGFDHHLFRVRLNGSSLEQLTEEEGFHRISMDPAGRFFTDDFSSILRPRTVVLRTQDGNALTTLATTDISQIEEYGLDPPEKISIKAADGITDIFGLLFKPADFDPSKKYPLVVSVYNGMYFKANFNAFQTTGFKARLAQLGFIVWELDGRCTAFRGKAFMRANYLSLGGAEVDDQALAVKELIKRPYIDGTRVGLFGHSYGGYMTCLLMLKHPDLFHVGIAGAPVTDWRNYDTICTEAYLDTPQNNPEGYEDANVLKYAQNLEGHLLICHGFVDNNVHVGNTLQLAHAFQRAGKPFDLMLYPKDRHGIRGDGKQHYTTLRAAYLVEHLKPENWEHILDSLW
ncbi:MAG: DPP IV N-terminal domain-containing protein [Candidatus Aminicenantes bacterium]|nr:DPP IV N-terminal domain-containing protein [Candidatus Aminicenantes bacterium]